MLCDCVDQQHQVVAEFLAVTAHNFVCLLVDGHFQGDHQRPDIPFKTNGLSVRSKFKSNDLPIEINPIEAIFLNKINT